MALATEPTEGLFDPAQPPQEMELTVFVVCRRCCRTRELTVRGVWDVAGVRHDCAGVTGFEIERSGDGSG